MAHASTAEAPLPVRTVARLIAEWVGRLGRVWVEGQVTQLTRRPGVSTVFLTLRDPQASVSLSVTCPRRVHDAVSPPLADGARVVVWAKPEVHLARGTLGLAALEIRPVGVGELLARIERLKAVLAAEGLFAPDRKRALPFLPRMVGLVCGRGSAAERDVLDNAARRWPAVRFRVEAVAVQGPYAVGELLDALRRLDRDPEVEVVVLARGGGSVEDLLPFSDEALLRAVAASRTPVVSAIGHEQDSPLLDLVADRRASTPTDAAKIVVPDVAEQLHRIEALTARGRRALATTIERESSRVAALRARPALADPGRDLDRRGVEVAGLRTRARRCAATTLAVARTDAAHLGAQLFALSPAATLARGYAVVQRPGGAVLRHPAEPADGELLRVRLAAGNLAARVERPRPDPIGVGSTAAASP